MRAARRVRTLAAGLAAAALAARALPAQVAPNRAAAYLHPSDVHDARAVWLNPAGLGVVYEASVALDVTVGDPGPEGRLRQLTAGFNSRGLALGYQRDELPSGVRGHTYRVGFGSSVGRLAAGAAVAHYRGATTATGWDVGVTYHPGPRLAVAVVVANIGQPVVRSRRQSAALVPSLTIRALDPMILSAHARFASDTAPGYAFGVRTAVRVPVPVGLVARLDTDGALRRRGFAFGVTVGGLDRIGVVLTTLRDLSAVDAASVYGVASRSLGR